MQLPSEYRAQIIEILKARGIPPTEENILKVANAKKPQPKRPSTGEQLLTGIGGAAATGLGMYGGRAIGEGIAAQMGVGADPSTDTSTGSGGGSDLGAAGQVVAGGTTAYIANEVGKQVAKQVANQAAAQVGTQAAGQAGTQAAAQVANQAASQVANQAAAQVGTQAAGQAGTQAAAQVGTQAAAQGGMGQIAPYVQGAQGVLGAYGMYNTIKDSYKRSQRGKELGMTAGSGAASGAAIGSSIDALTGGATLGAGTALGAIVGGLIGLGSGYFGSDKDKHQIARDYARDRMVNLGIYEHKPATDEVFSMGGDGGYRLPDGRRAFEIVKGMAEGAPEREFTQREGEVIGALNPLSYIVGQGRSRGDVDIAGNTTGLLYNELANRGEEGVTDAEILDLYSRAGATHGSAFEAINTLAELEAISEEEQRAAHNALNQIYGSEYYSTEDNADREAARRLLGL